MINKKIYLINFYSKIIKISICILKFIQEKCLKSIIDYQLMIELSKKSYKKYSYLIKKTATIYKIKFLNILYI